MSPLRLRSDPNGTIKLSNKGSAIAATADFYSWGLTGKGKRSDAKNPLVNLTAAGVQSFPDSFDPADRQIWFAITTEEAWSAPSTREFDVYIDANGDGIAEWALVGVDFGVITAGAFNGQMIAAIFAIGKDGSLTLAGADFFAVAPTDSSTILLPVLATSLGITPANPRFSYTATVFDFNSDTGETDSFAKSAKYNAFSSAITTNGQYLTLSPNGTASVPFSVDVTELATTPAFGLMVVTQDNKNGSDEVNLVEIEVKK